MSTRSRIAMETETGGFRSVYCHSDGYLAGVGAILAKHYDRAKTEQLLAQGDLSSLGDDIGTKHDFNARTGNVCTFYRRDRGEDDVDARSDATFNDLLNLAGNCNAEFLYVLRKDGRWEYVALYGDKADGLKPLAPVAKLAPAGK